MKEQKRGRTRFLVLSILVVALVTLGAISKRVGWTGSSNATAVEVKAPRVGTILQKVSAPGVVFPATEVKISPDVAGEITAIHVKEGEYVQAGDLLLEIKPDQLASALEQAEATLNQRKANLAEAKAKLASAKAGFVRAELNHKRNANLLREKVIAPVEFEQSEADYQIARNDIESAQQSISAAGFIIRNAQAAVNEARNNLHLTKIFAPMSGTLVQLSVEKGERVVSTRQMPGTEMLRISDLSRMELRVKVSENDIVKIHPGDTALVEVDSYQHLDKKFKGVVTAIASVATAKEAADAITEFEVRILILEGSYAGLTAGTASTFVFRPGMSGYAEIITHREEKALLVPLSSLTGRQARPAAPGKPAGGDDEVVFVLEGGKARLRKVQTGISDFEHIQIIKGLTAKDRVIAGPYAVVAKQLNEGTPVREAQ